jgi:hypothetical protein
MTMTKKNKSDNRLTLKTKKTDRANRQPKTNVAAAAAPGNCLTLSRAGVIVQEAVPNGPQDIDKTLEEVGLIIDDQRLVFREDVFDGVLEAGCQIDKSDIPMDGDNTLREVRDTIQAKAG